MIEILKKPCKLLLSLFLSLSFVSFSVFADEYSITPFIILPSGGSGELGYISMVNTGNDEWDTILSFMESNIGDSSSYACAVSTYGSIICGYNYSSYGSNQTLGFSNYAKASVNYSTGAVSYETGNNVALFLREYPFFCMAGIPDSVSNSSGITNLNAISFDDMINLYNNSDSSSASIQDVLDAIIDGTDDSGESADSAEDSNTDLENVLEQYENIESGYIDDFQENLSNIDVGGFQWGADFLTSAAWVTDQFNLLVMDTPFELLITYSLIIGIGLFLIGRYKGL